MTRKELLSSPVRKWDEELKGVRGVFVIPSKRKHDSGWACMDFVAETPSGLVRFGGCCDDVSFEGNHFRMDCDFETKLPHIWNRFGFTITHDLSSISFVEEKGDLKCLNNM